MPRLPQEPSDEEETIEVEEGPAEPTPNPATVSTSFGQVSSSGSEEGKIIRRIRNVLSDAINRIRRSRDESLTERSANDLVSDPLISDERAAFLLENRCIKKDGVIINVESSLESVRQELDTLERLLRESAR